MKRKSLTSTAIVLLCVSVLTAQDATTASSCRDAFEAGRADARHNTGRQGFVLGIALTYGIGMAVLTYETIAFGVDKTLDPTGYSVYAGIGLSVLLPSLVLSKDPPVPANVDSECYRLGYKRTARRRNTLTSIGGAAVGALGVFCWAAIIGVYQGLLAYDDATDG